MKSMGIDFHHQLTENRTIFELIPISKSNFETQFDDFKHNRQKQFNDFIANHTEKIPCNAQITGFDPMNMVRMGDKILCDRFVKLDGEFIQGPVMLEMAEGSMRQVTAYMR
jgi:hypothetical protein